MRFYLGPGLEEIFLRSFKFSIDPMIYQEEKEEGTGTLVYQNRGGLSAVGERMGMSHTLVCGIPEVD